MRLSFTPPRAPRLLFILVLLLPCLGFGVTPPTVAPAFPSDLPDIASFDSDHAHMLVGHATRLMQADNFAAIEAQAAALRATPYPAFRDGSPALAAFYDGLTPYFGRAENVWRNWQERYRRWEAAFPDSPTRPVAEAVAFAYYAWDARGGGFAHTVAPGDFSEFDKRIARARALLEAAPGDCPHRASTLLLVALAQSWSRETYDSTFSTALSRHPDYLPLYERKAIHLLPRWHGEEGELAAWAAAQTGPEGLYARIVFHTVGYVPSENLFAANAFSWERFAASADLLLARHPDSPQLLIRLAAVARQADKPEAARAALLRLPENYRPSSGQVADLTRLRRWAGLIDENTPELRALLRHQNFDPAFGRLSNFLGALAVSPDGARVAIGDFAGRVTLLNARDFSVVATRPAPLPGAIRELVFTPDGATLLVGRNLDRPGQPSAIDWLDASNLAPRRDPRAIDTTLNRLRLAPDGALFIFGGHGGKNSRLLRLSPEGDLAELRAVASHSHELRTAALRPDGAQIVAYCNRGVSFIHVAEDRDLLSTGTVLQGWIEELAYRPDGARVAAVSHGQHGAELAIWSSPDQPKPDRPRTFPSKRGNYHGLAWSPDGTRIAVAGADGSIVIHDAETGAALASTEPHSAIAVRVAYSPDARVLYSIGHDGNLLSWPAD
jgi:hypothetical protein